MLLPLFLPAAAVPLPAQSDRSALLCVSDPLQSFYSFYAASSAPFPKRFSKLSAPFSSLPVPPGDPHSSEKLPKALSAPKNTGSALSHVLPPSVKATLPFPPKVQAFQKDSCNCHKRPGTPQHVQTNTLHSLHPYKNTSHNNLIEIPMLFPAKTAHTVTA